MQDAIKSHFIQGINKQLSLVDNWYQDKEGKPVCRTEVLVEKEPEPVEVVKEETPVKAREPTPPLPTP